MGWDRCAIQIQGATAFRERRRKELVARIKRFREEGKFKILPAVEGKLKKVTTEFDFKMELIRKRQEVDSDSTDLAAGMILVDGGSS